MKVFCGLICAVQTTAVGGGEVSALIIGHFLPAAFAYQIVCPVGVLTNTPLPPCLTASSALESFLPDWVKRV